MGHLSITGRLEKDREGKGRSRDRQETVWVVVQLGIWETTLPGISGLLSN